MPIGYTNIHKHINVWELINNLNLIFVCEFNRVASWNVGKTAILVRSSFQITK